VRCESWRKPQRYLARPNPNRPTEMHGAEPALRAHKLAPSTAINGLRSAHRYSPWKVCRAWAQTWAKRCVLVAFRLWVI
jgi:hypothetical protein